MATKVHILDLAVYIHIVLIPLWYDIKQFDGEAPAMLEFWEMQSISSLPLLPGPLWFGMVTPDGSYGSNRTVWYLNWVQTNDLCKIELLEIELLDHLTVSTKCFYKSYI